MVNCLIIALRILKLFGDFPDISPIQTPNLHVLTQKVDCGCLGGMPLTPEYQTHLKALADRQALPSSHGLANASDLEVAVNTYRKLFDLETETPHPDEVQEVFTNNGVDPDHADELTLVYRALRLSEVGILD